MPIQRDTDGVIINANALNADDVAHKRVLCPACRAHVFELWPEGWDAHAWHKCSGVANITKADRKKVFKARYRYLFR